MSEVTGFPDLARVQREASDWLVRLNRETVSADDLADFECWVTSSRLNAKAYEELSLTWNRFASAGGTVRAVAFGANMNHAARKPRRPWFLISAAAACLVAVIGASMWMWSYKAPSSYETGIGEQASVTLPDGSRLTLNSDSKVTIEYSDAARVVRLSKGEAFFNVEHVADRPFWVLADRTWVRAVGTAFTVHNRERGVRVTVSEGVVKVGALSTRELETELLEKTDEGARLGRGQQVDMDGQGASFTSLAPARLERELSWSRGLVYFQDQNLREVVATMSRYTPLDITVSDGVGSTKISGTFHTSQQGVEEMLAMFDEGLSLDVVRDGRGRVRIEVAEAEGRSGR